MSVSQKILNIACNFSLVLNSVAFFLSIYALSDELEQVFVIIVGVIHFPILGKNSLQSQLITKRESQKKNITYILRYLNYFLIPFI